VSRLLNAVVAERNASIFNKVREQHMTFVVLLNHGLDGSEFL